MLGLVAGSWWLVAGGWTKGIEMTGWQQWLQHPERSSVRNALFQIHLCVGAVAPVFPAV
jgi:hypothetical protein